MRIQLTVDEPVRDGYIWGSPNNKDLKNPKQFYNCWEYCMEAQATEIYGPSILEIFNTSELEVIIPRWAKLIRPGGKILLGGTDFYILAKEGLRRAKDLGTVNDILFGKNYGICSITSIESTKAFLESLGFKTNNITLDYENFAYTVEAVKC